MKIKKNAEDNITTHDLIKDIINPEKFSRTSKNLDRVYQKLSFSKKSDSRNKLNPFLNNNSRNDKHRVIDINKLPLIDDKYTNKDNRFDPYKLRMPKQIVTIEGVDAKKEQDKKDIVERYMKLKMARIERKRKEKNGLVPEPGKYNPNYEIIYPRNPGVKIDYPIYNKPKNHRKVKSEFIKLKKENSFSSSQENTNVKKEKSNNLSMNPINYSHQENKTNTLNNSFGSAQKGLKFEYYSPRKGIIEEATSQIISYIEPLNYHQLLSPKNKSFNKSKRIFGFNMHKAKGRDFSCLVNSNNYPSAYDYYPNWSVTQLNITSKIQFDKKEDPEKDRIHQFKKILYSYNPGSDYKITQMKNFVENKRPLIIKK